MAKTGIPSNKNQKGQGSLVKVGIIGFAFTYFQTDNYGSSPGDDEGKCVNVWSGREVSQYKYCRYGWGQAYQNNRNIKNGGLEFKH